MVDFKNGSELIALTHEKGALISDIMLNRECDRFDEAPQDALKRMAHSWQIMKEAVAQGQTGSGKSMGGLIGGEAARLTQHRLTQGALTGTLISKAVSYAMGVLEVNASMGLITAAPTAGSSGVIPGVFCAMQEEYHFTDDQMIKALFNAGAVGYLATRNATVAGAEGGCQAEIGVAAAMAASSAVELMGGKPEQSLSAASSVLASMLGLVCDPIGGLVEVPCQKRNGTAASTALVCAEMALSGVDSLIPFDEMLEVMFKVGRSLPYQLRETALGGIAAAPTACRLCERGKGHGPVDDR
ncbi:MAG TPA: L-serine ammonia-lyase, iron-sulfur-dependent, subunit alpha [Lachnospiraceae bacterium]|nr:L-serine ammonia-lyase, iron-sulfur-dependent, subunit alpha [Lachnospiraceae bacterium]